MVIIIIFIIIFQEGSSPGPPSRTTFSTNTATSRLLFIKIRNTQFYSHIFVESPSQFV